MLKFWVYKRIRKFNYSIRIINENSKYSKLVKILWKPIINLDKFVNFCGSGKVQRKYSDYMN